MEAKEGSKEGESKEGEGKEEDEEVTATTPRVTVRGHAFLPLTFHSIVHCAFCKDLIWGLNQTIQAGVACAQCDLRMHKRCARAYKMDKNDTTECASVMTRFNREKNF